MCVFVVFEWVWTGFRHWLTSALRKYQTKTCWFGIFFCSPDKYHRNKRQDSQPLLVHLFYNWRWNRPLCQYHIFKVCPWCCKGFCHLNNIIRNIPSQSDHIFNSWFMWSHYVIYVCILSLLITGTLAWAKLWWRMSKCRTKMLWIKRNTKTTSLIQALQINWLI